MKVFVVHIINASDRPSDYYVHGSLDGALHQAAKDLVIGRFGQRPLGFEAEVRRVIDAVDAAPVASGSGRWYARCDSWRARIDELEMWP